jgi:selenide,water dikinase
MPEEPPVTSADATRRVSQNATKAAEGEGVAAFVLLGERRWGKESLRGICSPAGAGLLPCAHTLASVTETALTALAQAGGCAAKYSAARLETLLAGLAGTDAEDLLVGLDPADDAAVYRLDHERALVFTVDFFPPVVDDPYDFGAIAATNALNDVFAMGGRPLLALSVTAFPEELPTEVLGRVLAGAGDAVRAAGAILAGGHTIRDREPKYGLAVVGLVHPDDVWTKSGARPGDAVLLTKPLGTGLVLQAAREGRAPAGTLATATAAMKQSNREAAEALRPYGPSAVTDVTGFGLLGHAHETAERSGVAIVLDAVSLPALPGALELAAAGVRTGGDRRNRDFAELRVTTSASAADQALAYDPQTAGGLLITLPAERAVTLQGAFAAAGLDLWRIGRVEAGSGVRLD